MIVDVIVEGNGTNMKTAPNQIAPEEKGN